MSDIPGSTPEITTQLPIVEDPTVESVQYTQNDTGSQPKEIEKTEPLTEFAFFLRNINEGFRSTIQNQINADGVFLDTESEFNAIANWDQWHHHVSLPEIISTDEETLRATTAQFENTLQEIAQGIPDKDGNRPYLHYADIPQLETYFKQKYPDQIDHIEKVFENFHHDINLFGGGVDASFSADKAIRDQFKDYRHSSMLIWQKELIELAAQDLEQKPVEKLFNPEEKANEVKDVLDIVSKDKNANFQITIDHDHYAAPLPNDLDFYGNHIEFKRLIKNLLRYAQDYSINHEGLPIEQHITFSKSTQGKIIIQSIDTAGGFVKENERLINERVPAIPGSQELIKQKAFDRKEKGVNSKGSGFGLDMVWDIVVNKYHGMVKVQNEATSTEGSKPQVTGARFIIFLPSHTAPVSS